MGHDLQSDFSHECVDAIFQSQEEAEGPQPSALNSFWPQFGKCGAISWQPWYGVTIGSVADGTDTRITRTGSAIWNGAIDTLGETEENERSWPGPSHVNIVSAQPNQVIAGDFWVTF